MHLFKFASVLLVVCLLLVNNVKQTESEATQVMTNVLPIMASVAGVTFTGPLAPIVVGSCLIMSLLTKVLDEEKKEETDTPLTKKDYLEQNAQISQSIKSLTTQVAQMGQELTDAVETHGFLEEMRNSLDTLCETVADNYDIVIDPKIKGKSKEASLRHLLDYFSTFRQALKSFVSKFIKPKGLVTATGDVNLFYDFMLRRDHVAAENGDDCHMESVHTKLFKSYMYILKTLNDAYVMVFTAHAVQYQNDLKAKNEDEAHETKKLAEKFIKQYKTDMKALMEKTKWALDQSSRDIRSCGKFDSFRKGDDYDAVTFAVKYPKLKDWDYVNGRYHCFTREEDVKNYGYEINNCSDDDLKKPAVVKISVDPKKSEWPFVYLFNSPTFGSDVTLGQSPSQPGIITRQYFSSKSCYTEICDAYKREAVGVSTKVVSAEDGNVITGVRMVIKENIVHLEIKEAPFVDDLNVDTSDQYWIEQPKSDEVLYFDSKIRNFELGDVELPHGQYMKSIQFRLKNKEEGLIGLYVNGITSERIGAQWYPFAKSSEIPLSGSESPSKLGADVKTLISKPPLANRPYHVSLQPTDLKKELGAATIPFFDTRSVSTYPSAPVAGVGLYHHTVKGSGGFIALKIRAANMAPYVDYSVIEKIIDSSMKF